MIKQKVDPTVVSPERLKQVFGLLICGLILFLYPLLLPAGDTMSKAASPPPMPASQPVSPATMDLDFKDTDIRDVLRVFALQYRVNILADPEVKGPVTLHLSNVTLEEALTSLLTSYGYQYRREGNVYYVSKQTPPRPYRITYENKILTVDAQNVEIGELLREISLAVGVNILPDQTVSGRVSVLVRLPFEEALDALLSANGFKYQKEGELYRVTKADTVAKVSFERGLLSLEVRNQEIQQVLAQIARATGQNIIPDREVVGPVSGTLTALPLEKCLAAFLEANGFQLEADGEVYRVHKKLQAATPNFLVSLDKDGHFDIDVTNADSTQLFRELAKRAGVNLVIYNYAKTMINSVQLHQVTLEEAFTYLLKGTTFTFKKVGNTYLVGDGTAARVDSLDLVSFRSFKLKNVSAESVLSVLPAYLPAQNIRVLKEQNTLIIAGTPDLLDKFAEYLEAVDVKNEDFVREILPLKYLKAEDTVKLLPTPYNKLEIIVHKDQNSLVVNAPRQSVQELRDYLARIDLPQPQILFDVLLLEIMDRQSFESGITTDLGLGHATLSGKSGTLTYDIGVEAPKLNLNIKTLLDQGKARVRANPRLITLSGQEASFSVTDQFRYRETIYDEKGNALPQGIVKTMDTGIKLSLKPLVTASGEILIEVQPDISEVTAEPGPEQDLPRTSDRNVKTVLRVKDGQTIIIGGMIQTSKEKTERRVPILSDLPLLGWLFRYHSENERETEFVIYITPHLVTEANQTLGGFTHLEMAPPSVPAPAETLK